MELSKEAMEAMEMIRDILKKTTALSNVYSKLSASEMVQVGAVVVGVLSPYGNMIGKIEIGEKSMCYGILKDIQDDIENERNYAKDSKRNPTKESLGN
jgi:hypothetical protein